MSIIIDSATSLEIGDPERVPLSGVLPTRSEIAEAARPLILSASGWRKVFAVEGEESSEPSLSGADTVIAALMADAFATYLKARALDAAPLYVGIDARPTGPTIADAMCRAFISRGFAVRYLFVAAAPEIMAHSRGKGPFAYISASHNPIGHNGVKFGLDDGGVLAGDEAKGLIASYRALLERPDAAEKARELMRACPIPALRSCFESVSAEKTASLASYRAFTRHIVSAHADPSRADSFFRDLERSIASFASGGTPLSLATDFNGSARASSIDRSVFGELGIPFFEINGATGAIAHRIVPEGESLLPCADFLSSLKKGVTPEERGVVFGYVPDCDGDRGNIVYWDEGDSQPRILEAQEVFALSVVSELASLAREGLITVAGKGLPCAPPAAVAVNDPTSARIDAIARAFGVRVARAEVGEANVVGLARKLRDEGHVVRILGEGSNGGNITYPSSVRDPLDTVFALLKLLVLRDDGGKKGLFRLWCELSGRMDAYRDDFTFADIRASLPDYSTTSAFEEEAKLAVRTQDHAELKRRFQGVFLREWEARERDLARDFGIVSWQARAYNGMEERDSCRDFSLGRSGGLKILLLGKDREELGFLWMRPSGTESVFRIMAEAAGSDRSRERFLLSWLSRMVLEADSQIV